MSTFHLLFAEIGHRRAGFALSLLAVAVAATLFIAGPTLISGYVADTNRRIADQNDQSALKLKAMNAATEAELARMQRETEQTLAAMDKKTKRLMRDLGFNLRIVHKDTNMGDLYTGFNAVDMPEEFIHRLANATEIDKIVHLVATLEQKHKWQDRTILLVGCLPEVAQSHIEQKAPMGYNIPPGAVYLGHELGVGRKVGETIDVEGAEFKIAQILPEQGTRMDITLVMHLHDAQKVLGKKGKISKIMALGCYQCKEVKLSDIRQELAEVLPDTVITEHLTRRIARAEQRDLVSTNRKKIMEKERQARKNAYQQAEQDERSIVADLQTHRGEVAQTLRYMVHVTTPLVVLACAVFVGLMSWTNVRERRPEIGILRALGKGSGRIAGLFLGKAVVLGVIGGAIGCLTGYALALLLGLQSHETAAAMLPWTILGAPLITAMASYLPTLAAIRQDPAIVLQDQ